MDQKLNNLVFFNVNLKEGPDGKPLRIDGEATI
jgi:hypothetical protein